MGAYEYVGKMLSPACFERGNSNGDQSFDISDAIDLLGFLFLGDVAPDCEKSADVNDDGRLDVSDVLSLLNFLFRGSQAPSEPFRTCGLDPTPDNLTCVDFPGCDS